MKRSTNVENLSITFIPANFLHSLEALRNAVNVERYFNKKQHDKRYNFDKETLRNLKPRQIKEGKNDCKMLLCGFS